MRNDVLTNVVQKNTLIETQMNQLKLLKNNLESIKQKNLGYFPNSMKIEENDDAFIFNFESIAELNQRDNFIELFGVDNKILNGIIPQIIIRLMELVINLSKFGIHLPMLNYQHFTQTEDISIWINPDNIETQRTNIYIFGTEEFKKDNQDLIKNLNIPNEIIQKIIAGQAKQIKFNEKMTVFALGCIIYYFYTRHQVFINQNQQQLYDRLNNIIQDGQSFIQDEFKQLIENCTKENPDERPTLIELKEQYLKIVFLKENILDAGFSIYQFNEYIIAPNELITGRLYIMEFFAKIKFIKLFFKKQSQLLKDAKSQSNTLIILLINQELDKLKLDQYKELTLWDEDNTKDEINEFKKNYLNNYQSILQNCLDQIKNQKQQDQKIIQIGNSNFDIQINNKIKEIIGQLKNFNDKSSQINCLQNLNNIFKYRHLLEYFKPIQEQLINIDPYHRYDIILQNLFSNENNQQILDLGRITKIKQKI